LLAQLREHLDSDAVHRAFIAGKGGAVDVAAAFRRGLGGG
jgi:hypothetical protein